MQKSKELKKLQAKGGLREKFETLDTIFGSSTATGEFMASQNNWNNHRRSFVQEQVDIDLNISSSQNEEKDQHEAASDAIPNGGHLDESISNYHSSDSVFGGASKNHGNGQKRISDDEECTQFRRTRRRRGKGKDYGHLRDAELYQKSIDQVTSALTNGLNRVAEAYVTVVARRKQEKESVHVEAMKSAVQILERNNRSDLIQFARWWLRDEGRLYEYKSVEGDDGKIIRFFDDMLDLENTRQQWLGGPPNIMCGLNTVNATGWGMPSFGGPFANAYFGNINSPYRMGGLQSTCDVANFTSKSQGGQANDIRRFNSCSVTEGNDSELN